MITAAVEVKDALEGTKILIAEAGAINHPIDVCTVLKDYATSCRWNNTL